MPSHLGAEIRAWRTGANLTQEELARRVGVKEVTVSRWERGVNTPSRRSIEAIREATGSAVDAPAADARAPIYHLAERVQRLEQRVEELEALLKDAPAPPHHVDGATAASSDHASRAESNREAAVMASVRAAGEGSPPQRRGRRRPSHTPDE